jgi:hypothetical protein
MLPQLLHDPHMLTAREDRRVFLVSASMLSAASVVAVSVSGRGDFSGSVGGRAHIAQVPVLIDLA